MATHSPKLLGRIIVTIHGRKREEKKFKKRHELASAIHCMIDLVLLNSLTQMKLKKKEANKIKKQPRCSVFSL